MFAADLGRRELSDPDFKNEGVPMIDTVFNAVSDIVNGAGSLIEGIFVKQPSQDELKKQVRTLQASVDTLENSFKTQNDVIDMLLAQHGELKFYQFNQKASLQTMIENELVTQYAALDYFTILLEAATSGQRMAREDFEFFKTYSKMLQDGRIDSDELEALRPIMRQRHRIALANLEPCEFGYILIRIRCFEG